MTLTPEALKSLRERLPYGYTTRVVSKLDGSVSQALVSMVAHGKHRNTRVLTALVEVAEEYEREQEQARLELEDLERRAKNRA